MFLLVLCGCVRTAPHSPPAQTTANPEILFQRLANDFTKGYLAWRPQTATALGLHEYDGKISNLSMPSLETEYARLKDFQKKFAAVNPGSLSQDSSFDYRILETAIKSEIFQFEEMQAYTKNPMTYIELLDLNIYIKRNYAPLEQRVKSIIAVEKQVPALLAAAKANLEECLAKPYIETAVQMTRGVADFLKTDLPEALQSLQDPALQSKFKAANQRAIAEVNGFADWLEKEKAPKSHLKYALGREKFEKMLCEQEGITLSAERILEIGLKELKREQDIFIETAAKIDSSRAPIDVFKRIQKEHPTEKSLLPDTRKNLEAIRQFLADQNLVSIPSQVRPKVEETPKYDRATSFASMDTPGPFETSANEAYYYVTPVEPDWPSAQKDEWLTAFNYYTTDVVSIHEVYPGHYIQFLHLNASPASRYRKIFSSYAYVEGWAHYTEQMMIEQGYGKGGADPLRTAKYHLAQSDEALLRLCRLCVSIKTHCENMSLEDATRFFEQNCYYEHKPAYQEALRGTFDPGYLYYSLGKLALLKLRRDMQEQEGKAFALRSFHDALLGCPNIRLARESLLKNPKLWDELL